MGTLLFASGPVALLAPSQSWALPMNVLDDVTGQGLLAMLRRLYPHANMEDAVYALVIKDLDAKAASDPGVAETLTRGMADLQQRAGGDFAALDEARQQALLEAIEGTPFFALVRSTAVVSLYSNELAYHHFGYEGASFPKGGYLHRGFDDLSWQPSPPASASPAPFA